MQKDYTKYYHLALLLGLLFHASIQFFAFENTYDAYVHIFFADHYEKAWFDTWDYRWYSGFSIISYPPLVHQLIGLIAKLVGLKIAYLIVSSLIIVVFIRGIYKFSGLWIPPKYAALSAFIGTFTFSFVEALHVFGQLPSIAGTAVLLNVCPFIYFWIRAGKWKYLLGSVSLLAVTTSAHHVSTIFGTVFFVFPVIGLAIMDNLIDQKGISSKISLNEFMNESFRVLPKALILGIVTIIITLIMVLPYWLWSQSDPISQVPIPHGSRDNFIEEISSGLMFFIIPWGLMLLALPYIFFRAFNRRNIFLGISLSISFILGLGGTTPIAKTLLGETAFNILTFDRFTFWATIMSVPFWTIFIYEIVTGNLKIFIEKTIGKWGHRTVSSTFLVSIVFSLVLVFNLEYFTPLQPEEINIDPIVNFLDRDQHHEWRYLTLGFGDQMAWLSANTNALTVDGNYHSARRMPEFTTRAVERLENAKYKGTEGLTALQQFLTVPEKYCLKYIFSNDKFYDPVLFFTGWKKVQQLENNIFVWEKPDIPKLSSILPRKDIPRYQSWMWGTLPLSSFIITILIFWYYRGYRELSVITDNTKYTKVKKDWSFDLAWMLVISIITLSLFSQLFLKNNSHRSPDNIITSYFDALDFNKFKNAYHCLSPKSKPDFKQYMLELSLDGGVLSSYAKLENLDIQYRQYEKKNVLLANVIAHWVTSISDYSTHHQMVIENIDGDYYIQHNPADTYTPPDQFFAVPEITFFNQGRRKPISNKVFIEDELDRPEVLIENTRMVIRDGQYHVIGEIINADNDPTYINVKAMLIDSSGKEIVSYNAKDIIIHNLLPKERTAFRIDFQDAFKQLDPSKQKLVDVKESLSSAIPERFALFVRTMTSDGDTYKLYGIQNFQSSNESISAEFINYGNREINIPQVISATYTKNGKLLWVEGQYLSKSIRPQRKTKFQVEMDRYLTDIQIIEEGNPYALFVNGNDLNQIKDQDIHQSGLFTFNDFKIDFFTNAFTNEK